MEAQKEEETVDDENGSEASMQQTLTSCKVTIGHFEKTVASLQSDVKGVHDQQMDMADRFQHDLNSMADRFQHDLNSIKSLLNKLIFQQQQQQFSHAGEVM